jgi:hypothetical protein
VDGLRVDSKSGISRVSGVHDMFSAEQNSSVYAHFCCFYLKTKQDHHLRADTENCVRQKEIVILMIIFCVSCFAGYISYIKMFEKRRFNAPFAAVAVLAPGPPRPKKISTRDNCNLCMGVSKASDSTCSCKT